MKKLQYIILFFVLGCATKNTKSSCNENMIFKQEFFNHISIVENITYGKETKGNIHESLKFISQYAHVSYDKLQNYKFGYNFGDLETDKEGWLKWYEENKCKNIQFK